MVFNKEPALQTVLQDKLATLQERNKALEELLNTKIEAISNLVSDKEALSSKTGADLLLRLGIEQGSLSQEEGRIATQLRDLSDPEKNAQKTTTFVDILINFFLWLIGGTERQMTEKRQTFLAEAKPLFESAINLLKDEIVPLNEEVAKTEKALKAENVEIDTLKQEIKSYLSSTEMPAGTSFFLKKARQAWNATMSNDDLPHVALALKVFLDKPNGKNQKLLSTQLSAHSNYKEAKCFEAFQKLLDKTQAIYGPAPDPKPVRTFKEKLEEGSNGPTKDALK